MANKIETHTRMAVLPEDVHVKVPDLMTQVVELYITSKKPWCDLPEMGDGMLEKPNTGASYPHRPMSDIGSGPAQQARSYFHRFLCANSQGWIYVLFPFSVRGG